MGSEEFWALYGIENPGRGKPPSELTERLHPEDRRSVLEAVRGSLEAGAGAHVDHRVVLPDGAERVLQTQVQSSGTPTEGLAARGHRAGRHRAAARRGADPLPRLPRQPDRPRQPAPLHRAAGARDRRRRAAAARCSACCSSTSTTSSASTTRSATRSATSCCAASRTGSCSACARATPSARSATSSRAPISRLGGDEFTVLVDQIARPARPRDRGRARILELLARPFELGRPRGGDRREHRHRGVARSTATTSTRCCATPTRRCTTRRSTAGTATSSTPSR